MARKKVHLDFPVYKLRLLILSLFTLAFIFFVFYLLDQVENKAINSFEKCEKATGVILESYPRKCSLNGKTFTEKLSEEQLNQLKPLPESDLVDQCGDKICQEVACLAKGCPKPENIESCPQDCKE